MSATGDEGSTSSDAPDVRSPARSGAGSTSLRRAWAGLDPPPAPAEEEAGTGAPGGLPDGAPAGAVAVSSVAGADSCETRSAAEDDAADARADAAPEAPRIGAEVACVAETAATAVGLTGGSTTPVPVSYTHLTLPTTPYV